MNPSDGMDLPKVEIHATAACNNRCSFCSTGWQVREGTELRHPPRELIRQHLEEGYARGARRVLFQGGEPTVRRDLGDLLEDSRAIGYQATTVFTNARMAASRAGAAWLVSLGVTWFQVSIQGGNAAAHDASVGVKGAFAQTVRGARRLVTLGQRVKVNAVLTAHLLDSLADFARLMAYVAPEEVGLDTVKPSAAFDEGRERYGDLNPPLSRYSVAIRDAVVSMNRAGIVARLTSFPPCLAPGAEHFVSEESKQTVSQRHSLSLFDKAAWKGSLQTKAPACAECVYDATCGGVYRAYADVNGLGELRPVRDKPSAEPRSYAEDAPLTRALRQLLVRPHVAPFGVREVRRLGDGSHELECWGPLGGATILVAPRSEAPSYAQTARFSVGFRPSVEATPPDDRLLDAIVRRLRQAERS